MDSFNSDFKDKFDTFTMELNAIMGSLRVLEGTSETMQGAPEAMKLNFLGQAMEKFREAKASMEQQLNSLPGDVCSSLKSMEGEKASMVDTRRKLESQYASNEIKKSSFGDEKRMFESQLVSFQTAMRMANSLEEHCKQDVENARRDSAIEHHDSLTVLQVSLADPKLEAEKRQRFCSKATGGAGCFFRKTRERKKRRG
jgi:hypothetical protein